MWCVMPAELPVSLWEWRLIEPVIRIAKKIREKRGASERVSRYTVTKFISILEEYIAGTGTKTGTVVRIVETLERDFWLTEEEKQEVAEAVARLVSEISKIMAKRPEIVPPLLRSLRYVAYGVFSGIVSPVPYKKDNEKKSEVGENAE